MNLESHCHGCTLNPVLNLRAICQESRLDIYFPGPRGRRKRTLIGRCGAEEEQSSGCGKEHGQGAQAQEGPRALEHLGCGISSLPDFIPSTHCTSEETEPRCGKGLLLGHLRCGGLGFELVHLGLPYTQPRTWQKTWLNG